MIPVDKVSIFPTSEKAYGCCCCSYEEYLSTKMVCLENAYFDEYLFLENAYYLLDCESGVDIQCQCNSPLYSIQIRKSGSLIILLLLDHLEEYFYSTKAVWCIDSDQYALLQKFDPAFPALENTKLLTKQDCAKIFKYEWPEAVGTFGRKNDWFLNTDAAEGKEIVTILEKLLSEYEESNDPVLLKPLAQDSAITIIVDNSDYFEWKPLYKKDTGYGLVLDGIFEVHVKKDKNYV